MSMIENHKDLNQIIQDYKELLSNLDPILKNIRPRSMICQHFVGHKFINLTNHF